MFFCLFSIKRPFKLEKDIILNFKLIFLSFHYFQQAEERHQVIYWPVVWEEGEGWTDGADCWQGWTAAISLIRSIALCP